MVVVAATAAGATADSGQVPEGGASNSSMQRNDTEVGADDAATQTVKTLAAC